MAEAQVAVAEATPEQVDQVLHPEKLSPKSLLVGGKDVRIAPFKRRWQSLFAQAAFPLLKAELMSTEEMGKMFVSGRIDFSSLSMVLMDSEMEIDRNIDRAAAVVLASQVPGSNQNPEEIIQQQIAWIQDQATTAELRALIEAQAKMERLVEAVGERLPARFERSSLLAGRTDVTADTVKQHLNSYYQKLQEQTGAGNSI